MPRTLTSGDTGGMNTILTLWLIGAVGLVAGGVAGWTMGRRGTGLGAAALVAVAIGLTSGLVMAVYIVHLALASTSPNAPLALMAVPVPILSNTFGALVAVLVVTPVAARVSAAAAARRQTRGRAGSASAPRQPGSR